MDRRMWIQSITKDYCPPWPCPVCKRGHFRLVANSLASEETVQSRRAHSSDGWAPEWINYGFTAWAQCSNNTCGQKFALAGEGGVSPEFTGNNGDWEWADYFKPFFCQPMPEIIQLPAKCPEAVSKPLRVAFSLFWANPSSCANQIRVALEGLMDSLGVPRRKKTAMGKYSDLTLHARIDHFAQGQPTTGGQLMALKWVGNAGSHQGEVSKNDLLDAFEVLDHALVELIDQRSERVSELAKKLTRKHGQKKK
jgi:hypothetical protein